MLITYVMLEIQKMFIFYNPDGNKLEPIEAKFFKNLRNADSIDLTSNLCIDLSYQKDDSNRKAFTEFCIEIDLAC
jgi:hypothetical protein